MRKILLIIATVFITGTISAQYGYRDSNRIGISGGMNQFTLNTSNFETSPGTGWNVGLAMRGNYYNDFDMVFGLQFSENNFSVATLNGLTKEDVNFKISSAQLTLQLSYKFIENHLSVELGPMLQVNGKATIDPTDEENIVYGRTYTAKDITDISNFSLYPTIGITAGVRHVRANITYQYGVTNILGHLNDQGFGNNFKGHAGILSGNLVVYL